MLKRSSLGILALRWASSITAAVKARQQPLSLNSLTPRSIRERASDHFFSLPSSFLCLKQNCTHISLAHLLVMHANKAPLSMKYLSAYPSNQLDSPCDTVPITLGEAYTLSPFLVQSIIKRLSSPEDYFAPPPNNNEKETLALYTDILLIDI